MIFLSIYLSTLSGNLSASHDSANYANRIISGKYLFHPHHLLYNGVSRLWLMAWRSCSSAPESVTVIPILNAVFGALALCVFYSLLRRRMQLGRAMAAAGTALPAFSFGFWFYSVCIEVYIIPLFFLLLTFYLLTSEKRNEKTFALVGLTHGLCVLFHQLNVLFIPVIVLSALLRHKRTGAPIMRMLGWYAATVAPIVAVPYLAVLLFAVKADSPARAWHWLTLYGHQSYFWNTISVSTTAKAVMGFSRCMVGAHFVLASATRTLAAGTMAGHGFSDKTFLVRNMSDGLAYALLGLAVVLAAGLLVAAIARLRTWRTVWGEHRLPVLLALTWLGAYACFFYFWEPWNVEFWIPQSMCVWLLFMALWAVPREREKTGPRVACVAGIGLGLLVVNLLGSMIWIHDPQNDFCYATVHPLTEMARPGDLAITAQANVWDGYLDLYTQTRLLALSDVYHDTGATDAYIQRVQDAINEAAAEGRTVFVFRNAVQLEPDTIRAEGEGIAKIGELWDRYRSRWRQYDFEANTYYIIPPPSP